jgi:hypothetical protein
MCRQYNRARGSGIVLLSIWTGFKRPGSCCGFRGTGAPTSEATEAGSSVLVQPGALPGLRVRVRLCLHFPCGLRPWSSEIREARSATVDAAEAASD